VTVTSVRKDPQNLTMTLEAEFAATPERIWQLWSDPRQLERWWGPPGYPATFTQHDLAPGSRIEYYMLGPYGDRHSGYWEVIEVNAPRVLLLRAGFTNPDGSPNADLALGTIGVRIEAVDQARERMSVECVFLSSEVMEQVLATGTDEGMKAAMGQIDAIVAEGAAPAS
jgi:uncharacterized protein YndB with AHSA1/START domain